MASVLTDLPSEITDTLKDVVPLCIHCGFPLKKNKQAASFCCYGCAFAHQVIKDGGEGKTISWVTLKLGIAAFCAMNVMGFALALHASSIYPDFYIRLSEGGKTYDELLRYFLLFMSAPVFFLVGVPLYENVIIEARAGRWSVEGFIGMSVLAALGYSLVNTLRGSGPVYYDITVMVLVFLTLGRYLEARFRFQASQKLKTLLNEERIPAVLSTPQGEQEVSAQNLSAGDCIVLRAGQKVPVDGVVEEGRLVLETAPMTGEFLPVTKEVSSAVWAGAYVAEGFAKIRVTHTADASWLARLRETLQKAQSSKAPIEFFADRIVFWMTLATVIFAGTGLVLGWREQGAMGGVLRALSVLVIVCPCALGAAIPLALWKSFEKIVRRGILFKDLSRLEILSKVRGVFFDKTGTLTETMPGLSKVSCAGGVQEENCLRMAAGLAQASAHPLSKALVGEALARGLSLEFPREIQTVTGEGLSGWVFGKKVYLGSYAFLKSHQLNVHSMDAVDFSRVFTMAGWDQEMKAIFFFEEKIRPEARETVARLKEKGFRVGVLTGDSGSSASRWAERLHMISVTGLSPEAKYQWIREWEKQHGPALVIGEGLNDAPMMAGAGVSLAIEGALEKTRDASDFVLPDNRLDGVVNLLEIAQWTMKKIKRNLFWAFFYNLLAVPAAVFGIMNPAAAALLMILSSVWIILQSLKEIETGSSISNERGE